ncbi:MAG TPA: hypothetical protein VN892_04025 [Solirubrobacteraceae bacterium]|nr:hypothetical protein [Solirubrobacteraceae bacterium]
MSVSGANPESRNRPNRLAGHTCKAVSRRRHKGKPCTLYVAVPHGVSRAEPAGADRIVFDGVLDGGARLAPGTSRLSLSATNIGARATAAQRPTFTLLG